MSEYPEHEKLRLIKDKSQACGAFYEWLQEHGYVLATRHEHTESCYADSRHEFADCGLSEGELFSTFVTRDNLLAKFFEIDLDKLEKEKLAMIEELRAANKK